MHGVTAQTLHAEEKCDGCLELCCQKKHLEVEEWLLTGWEMRLACGEQLEKQWVQHGVEDIIGTVLVHNL